MRLAIDVRTTRMSGVARYGLSLLRPLLRAAADAGSDAIVLHRANERTAVSDAVAAAREERPFRGHDRIRCVEIDGADRFVRASSRVRELLCAHDVDLYYTSHYLADPECPVPFVFTIHDLTRLRFPTMTYTDASFSEEFGRSEFEAIEASLAALAPEGSTRGDSPSTSTFGRYFYAVNRVLAARAAHIVAVSEATRCDVVDLLGVEDHRVSVVPCGVDVGTFSPQPDAAVDALRRRLGLDGPYLLFVGAAHPHKRLSWLIEALWESRCIGPGVATLAVLGGQRDQFADALRTTARLGCQRSVAFLGRVSDQDLACLYTGAAALVSASLNEGNNLPPLEAMACGAEVVAPAIPALRETLGSAAHFYPPDDAAALGALARAAVGGALGRRAGLFLPPCWESSALHLFALIERLVCEGVGRA